MKMLDLFGHPIPEPEPEPDEEAEQRHHDLVLVVRNGISIRKLAPIGIDPEPVIARMLADGVVASSS